MNKKIYLVLFTLLAMLSCDASKDLTSAYNMTKCKYSYNSMSSLVVSDIDLSSGFSLAQLPKITALLSDKHTSIPTSFTLNLNITNPNPSTASFNGMDYILSIDDIEFTRGEMNKAIKIAPGKTEELPVNIEVDLVKLMDNNSKNAVLDIARNIIGISNKSSKVTMLVKPKFMVKDRLIPAPSYIPFSFDIGKNVN